MLSTDDIFLLSMELASDTSFCCKLRNRLHAIHASSPYQAWLGTLSEVEPFVLSDTADIRVLEKAKLARCGRLPIKLNRTADGIFVTDGVWVEPGVRVFPFCDESAALIGFVRKTDLARWADLTIDLATGCGLNAMALGVPSVAFDINPRALAYAAVNRSLNGIPSDDCVLALNDIRNGIPKAVTSNQNTRALVLANMPFGPAPSLSALPLTSNGGESGSDLQIAAYAAVKGLIQLTTGRCSVRACLMGLSVGDHAAGRWEIVERARDYFGVDRVRWHLLSEEHVFRVDGRRQLVNPAPVATALPTLASCRLYTPNENERTAKLAAFADLAKRLERRGNLDIAYGIVEITDAF